MSGTSEKKQIAQATGLAKNYEGKAAVSGLSFEVFGGEILGVLGPNGAGKTTTIRMLMGIIFPDSGSITMFGRPQTRDASDKIGYLPEERGVYKNETCQDYIAYIAILHGMKEADARQAAGRLLERFGLAEYKAKKVSELSKGMAQKVQIAATIAHGPELIVLDEPFSGLDPVSSEQIKEVILELKNSGAGIILCTHQMEQAERMCDRILMINKGRRVLYGTVESIKAGHGSNSLKVSYSAGAMPKKLDGASKINDFGQYAEIMLEKGHGPETILPQLLGRLKITSFELEKPSFHEIFLEVIEHG